MTTTLSVTVRRLGLVEYAPTLERMRVFTETRTSTTPDEIWLLEHPPVFTLGTNADKSHVLNPGSIPVIKVDRGGQVTYHGPGQLVAYVLMDLARARLGVRELVCRLENAIVDVLALHNIIASGRDNAPGVYTENAKIASIGLRIRRNCSYHGIALNVNADLEPFSRINPCGYAGLTVTSTAALNGPQSVSDIADALLESLLLQLNLNPNSA
jgi:lipoyl(octanoyl) transferase